MTNFGPQFLSRAKMEKFPFKSLGTERRAIIIELENVSIGDDVRIDTNVTIVAVRPPNLPDALRP